MLSTSGRRCDTGCSASARSVAAESSIFGADPSGSTPAPAARFQERATSSRRIEGEAPLLSASSCARRSRRAHRTGSTRVSIPIQGLRNEAGPPPPVSRSPKSPEPAVAGRALPSGGHRSDVDHRRCDRRRLSVANCEMAPGGPGRGGVISLKRPGERSNRRKPSRRPISTGDDESLFRAKATREQAKSMPPVVFCAVIAATKGRRPGLLLTSESR